MHGRAAMACTPRMHEVADQVQFLDESGEGTEAFPELPETGGSTCRGFSAAGAGTSRSRCRGFVGLAGGLVLLFVGVCLVSDHTVSQDYWRSFGKDFSARRSESVLDKRQLNQERGLVLGPASCASYGCAPFNPAADCQCNNECREHGSCCSDFEERCAPPPPVDAESCAAYGCTEFNPSLKCQCNDACREYGNCCFDFEDNCGAPKQGLALPAPMPEEDSDSCGSCGDAPDGHEDAVTVYAESCASPSNKCCAACGLWNAMDHGSKSPYQVIGSLILPSEPVAGVESITQASVPRFDFLWDEAAKVCGRGEQCALIVNPSMARTQHHLHVFSCGMASRGLSIQDALMKLTNCSASDWVDATPIGFGECTFARARVYNEIPRVFSEVFAEALRNPAHLGPLHADTLSTIGIAVMFGCQGKTMVLATSAGGAKCSIEHRLKSNK